MADQVTVIPELWAQCMDLALEGVTAETGPVISSRYPGRCVTCTGRWEPGDLIAFDQGEDAWICADCAA